MAENSGIEWTTHTFNPWRGCTKVSAGCTNCYADTMAKRNPAVLGIWGDNGTRVVAAESYWRQPLKWNKVAQKAGERHRVFCASMADVFEDRPELIEPRRRLVELIDATPNLDWLVLTKRPENIRDMLPPIGRDVIPDDENGIPVRNPMKRPNLWLGTSVENQATADERIPHLLRVPAAVRFLSCEPLLGPVDLSHPVIYQEEYYCGICAKWFDSPGAEDHCPNCGNEHTEDACPECGESDYELTCPECGIDGGNGGLSVSDVCQREIERQHGLGIDWVIVGGESGPKARPCDVAWIRSIRDQCKAAGVACFVKQLGAKPYDSDAADHVKGARRKFTREELDDPIGAAAAVTVIERTLEAMAMRLRDKKGGDWSEWPADLRVREFPVPVPA